jgi:hypothetical protein
MSVFSSMVAEGLLSPPAYLPAALQYEVLMGSHAIGTANAESDRDIFGVCVTPEEAQDWHYATMMDREYPAFERIEAGGVPADGKRVGCDFSIDTLYNFLVRCAEGKSMAIEMLFVAEENVLFSTEGGRILRANRDLYLCKSTVRGFIEFSRRQLQGMIARDYQPELRQKYVDKFGYDVKAAYHSVRLLHQAEQILDEGDLDLRRNAGMLRDIRRGAWSESEVVSHCETLALVLECKLEQSRLPDAPDGVRVGNVARQIVAACQPK